MMTVRRSWLVVGVIGAAAVVLGAAQLGLAGYGVSRGTD